MRGSWRRNGGTNGNVPSNACSGGNLDGNGTVQILQSLSDMHPISRIVMAFFSNQQICNAWIQLTKRKSVSCLFKEKRSGALLVSKDNPEL
jgi:hypothetical protein